MQTTTTRIHDPAKAKAYFEDKLAFTTGPLSWPGGSKRTKTTSSSWTCVQRKTTTKATSLAP